MTAFVPAARSPAPRFPYDRATVHAVLDAGLVAHVGYVIDGQPYVTPTVHWRHGERLYWHGGASHRLLAHVSEGLPACLTVTQIDGVVLGRSGGHSALNYHAALCSGRAMPVRDAAEKERAMHAFVERLTPGRWAELRPLQAQELDGTLVLAMTIEQASLAMRDGGPQDDAADYALPIWAGVVPLRLTAEAPIPDARLAPGIMLPDSVAGMVAALKHPPERPS